MVRNLFMTVVLDPEATRITHTAAYAMARADLSAALEDVGKRLLRSDCRGLLECTTEEVAVGRLTLRLRPFAELVLLSATDIATTTVDAPTKERRIAELLTLAGY